MKRFLRETWELWYWAMFCPSRLQQRMNEWAPAEEKDGLRSDTHSWDILLLRQNFRFISQFVLLIFLFSLPLMWGIALHGHTLDLLLVFGAIAIAYSIGILCLPIGLHIPLLFYFTYPVNPQIYLLGLDLVQGILAPYWYFFLAATGLIGLIISTLTYMSTSDEVEITNSSLIVLIVGGIVVAIVMGIVVGSFVQNTLQIIVVVLVGAVVGTIVGAVVGTTVGAVVGTTVGIVVGTVVGSIMIVIMGGIAAIVVGSIATLPLPLPLFLLTCWLIAASLSPTMQSWLVIITAVTLTALGFYHHGWLSFLAVPVTLMSYYRLPDYLILTLIDLLLAILLIKSFQQNPVRLLHLLPPYTTELVWLPLLNHDRILAAAFRTDASATLATFQKMQALSLPYLRFTIEQALPQIITDQLTAITNISELIGTATPEHPVLPLLAPTFYQTQTLEKEIQIIQTASSSNNSILRIWFIIASVLPIIIIIMTGITLIINTGITPIFNSEFTTSMLTAVMISIGPFIMVGFSENYWRFDIEDGTDINKLLPRLQIIAKDVDAALKGGNPAIQERGLMNILNNLRSLEKKLYGLEFTTRAVKRWEPVLVRWQRVIKLELQERQQQSQDELLNPFQYGNPLRSDRANLFRGRQKFADEIVRLILDRNRPTLVLHGPRRCGKTSFLYNLPRLLPSSLLPVYLDIQSPAITTDEAGFCQGLVRAIHRDSRSQGIELPMIPTRKEFLETPYITLEDWLEQALPRLGERRLLLNLDEFEKIGTAIKEKRLSLNLFDELRHLIQHYDSLAFLFSGVQTLDELGPNWSSYFISVVPLEMTYLEPDEAESLLTNPDPEFALHYDRGIVEEIIQLTRCQPYLLQLLGSALVTQANLNHTQLVTPDLLQAAIPEAFTNGEPYFTNVWTEFTGNNPAEIIAGQEFLLELANGLAPGHSQDLTDAAIRRLRRYHAIEQTDNGYVFEVPLLERWVRERAVKNSNY
ncbi:MULTISPECIES: AAA family ATPase [unclassified Microcoleus]|uniref:AAA family ATPase n=1 Tax=unclassified Microcoleus TaxID=2642155 RepID=UPI0025DF2E0E|nr:MULTISPECIES: AAA family ATPase [unclassified Microcoleus]